MIKLNTIEKSASVLHTPYCDFTVIDENGNKIIFDIMDSPEKDPTVWIEESSVPIQCFAGRTLRLYTKDLEIKKNYYICPSIKLETHDSDERLFTHGLTGENYTLAVSFPDFNEDIKFRDSYTEDDFTYCDVEYNNINYILRLYDREYECIDIFIFWIWNIKHHMSEYESACDVATWWCP